jgi:pimeloyl-ACP methyl ester carboxylesterase
MNNILTLLLLTLMGTGVLGQHFEGKYLEANYEESKVPEYILPDVLSSFSGERISTVSQWEQSRRPEIMDFFARNIYGVVPTPSNPIQKTFRIISEDTTVLDGLCTRRDVLISFENESGKVSMPLVLFVPNHASDRVPLILLASGGDIRQKNLRLDNPQSYGRTRNGIPLHQLMKRGIGIATVDYLAFGVDPRHPEGKVSGGIAALFFKEGQEYTGEDQWGMISIWAYALRAGMDYLETDRDVHPHQVATLGCSIGGKVALWAAAGDPRFGMTLLATAGHGGDAIWRREYGETLQNMCDYLPTWICRNAGKFAGNVHDMPVDQHCLLATMAPRPLYVSCAQHDLWADPKGQWIGTCEAAPAYELYGLDVAFTSPEPPPINQPVIKSSIGFHLRSGVHGLELYDWEQYMKFVEYHFMDIEPRSVEEVYNSHHLSL